MPRPRGLTINPTALDDVLLLQKMSRATLAARLGVSAQRLSDIERGKRVGVATVVKMSSFLHVYPATLFPEMTRVNGGSFTWAADSVA